MYLLYLDESGNENDPRVDGFRDAPSYLRSVCASISRPCRKYSAVALKRSGQTAAKAFSPAILATRWVTNQAARAQPNPEEAWTAQAVTAGNKLARTLITSHGIPPIRAVGYTAVLARVAIIKATWWITG